MEDRRIRQIKDSIRDVPDYPKKGIIFKDITTLLQDGRIFRLSVELLMDAIAADTADAVAAIESRGFIFGSVLAVNKGMGFVPIRKPGKLPAEVLSEEYDLEYGKDKIEIHADAIKPGQRIILVDDLLATGGTAKAACKLIEKSGGVVESVLFLIELTFLQGRNVLKEYRVKSIIDF